MTMTKAGGMRATSHAALRARASSPVSSNATRCTSPPSTRAPPLASRSRRVLTPALPATTPGQASRGKAGKKRSDRGGTWA